MLDKNVENRKKIFVRGKQSLKFQAVHTDVFLRNLVWTSKDKQKTATKNFGHHKCLKFPSPLLLK